MEMWPRRNREAERAVICALADDDSSKEYAKSLPNSDLTVCIHVSRIRFEKARFLCSRYPEKKVSFVRDYSKKKQKKSKSSHFSLWSCNAAIVTLERQLCNQALPFARRCVLWCRRTLPQRPSLLIFNTPLKKRIQ